MTKDERIIKESKKLIRYYKQAKNSGDWVPSARNSVVKQLNKLESVVRRPQ